MQLPRNPRLSSVAGLVDYGAACQSYTLRDQQSKWNHDRARQERVFHHLLTASRRTNKRNDRANSTMILVPTPTKSQCFKLCATIAKAYCALCTSLITTECSTILIRSWSENTVPLTPTFRILKLKPEKRPTCTLPAGRPAYSALAPFNVASSPLIVPPATSSQSPEVSQNSSFASRLL